MKKLGILLSVFTLLIATSCADNGRDMDIVEDPIPEGAPDQVITDNEPNRTNGRTTGNGNALVNDDYTTSLEDIETNLQNAMRDAEGMRVETMKDDYLAKETDYYTTTANAYRTALNRMNDLEYTGENQRYHQAITDYYQRGYDRFNELSGRYGQFNTVDDETTFRNEMGEDYFDIDDDIRDAYDDALRSLNLNLNRIRTND